MTFEIEEAVKVQQILDTVEVCFGSMMRFVGQDVRDHIGSLKNDHGHSFPRQRPLQRWRRRELLFREILGVVRFSTFSIISAKPGRRP